MIENTKNLIEDPEPSLSSNVQTKYLGNIENFVKKGQRFCNLSFKHTFLLLEIM